MVSNNLKHTTAAFVNLKDNEAAARYVKDIMSKKPLKADEEFKLFEKYNSPITPQAEKERIRAEIIERNQRFVYAVAKRYAQDETLLDFIGEGNIGMIKAFDKYDYTRGVRFCTHAVYYIRQSINEFLMNDANIIRKTNCTKTLSKVSDIQEEFFKKEGRLATNDELIDILAEEPYNIKIINPSDLYDLKIDSINMGYDDEDSSAFENSELFTSKTSVSEESVDNSSSDYTSNVLDYLKSFLNEKELEVINLSFGDKELSNKEIGELLGVTSERARQIKNSAIEKMKLHSHEAVSL